MSGRGLPLYFGRMSGRGLPLLGYAESQSRPVAMYGDACEAARLGRGLPLYFGRMSGRGLPLLGYPESQSRPHE